MRLHIYIFIESDLGLECMDSYKLKWGSFAHGIVGLNLGDLKILAYDF